ncbi:hypothetical protein PFY12_04115 [Chryseobacterium camelliae]|uniref:Uncharacterized protein n=1 Tax=Chryseobacterium camelliae TaxID=1265445 RepID=A0ABY7QQJ8_9FLAO|nr:hypothetical protein [Chryseobacterium camelliae]WBV61311.1 hypothetical protein PFY12_04115 [Chryseobacterium camelliae]
MKTKLGLIGLLMIFNIFIINGQTLSKEVRKDFCINAKYNYFYGTNSFFGLMNLTLKKIGINDPYKMDEAVKNICNNESLQNSFFESVHSVSRGLDRQQYLSLGMKQQNVEVLYNYVNLKYNSNNQNIKENGNNGYERIDHNFVVDSIVVNKKEVLTKMFPKSHFINDSTIVRKQPVTYIEGGDGEIEYKTSVVKEYYYIDEKDYEEKVNVVLISTDNHNNSFLQFVGKNSRNEKINLNKMNNYHFNTVKENGFIFFVIKYLDENNLKKENYYNPLTFKLVKTLIKNEDVQADSNSPKNGKIRELPIFTYNKLIDKYDYEDGESMSSEIVKEYKFLYGVIKKVINNNGDNDYKIHITKTTKEFDDLHSDMSSFVNKDIIVNLEPDDLYNKSGKIKDGWKGRYDLSFDDYKKLKGLLVEGRKIKFSYVEGGTGALGTATAGLFFFNYIEKID